MQRWTTGRHPELVRQFLIITAHLPKFHVNVILLVPFQFPSGLPVKILSFVFSHI
jgi:hypothetical protein